MTENVRGPLTNTLPDGRVVECLDVRLVAKIGDMWVCDVDYLIDGSQLGCRRVNFTPSQP